MTLFVCSGTEYCIEFDTQMLELFQNPVHVIMGHSAMTYIELNNTSFEAAQKIYEFARYMLDNPIDYLNDRQNAPLVLTNQQINNVAVLFNNMLGHHDRNFYQELMQAANYLGFRSLYIVASIFDSMAINNDNQ